MTPPTESGTVPLPHDAAIAARASLLLTGMADDIATLDPLALNAAAYIRAAGRGEDVGKLHILDDVEIGYAANGVVNLFHGLLARQKDDPVSACALVLLAPLMTALHREITERAESRATMTDEHQDSLIAQQVEEHRTRRRMGGDMLN